MFKLLSLYLLFCSTTLFAFETQIYSDLQSKDKKVRAGAYRKLKLITLTKNSVAELKADLKSLPADKLYGGLKALDYLARKGRGDSTIIENDNEILSFLEENTTKKEYKTRLFSGYLIGVAFHKKEQAKKIINREFSNSNSEFKAKTFALSAMKQLKDGRVIKTDDIFKSYVLSLKSAKTDEERRYFYGKILKDQYDGNIYEKQVTKIFEEVYGKSDQSKSLIDAVSSEEILSDYGRTKKHNLISFLDNAYDKVTPTLITNGKTKFIPRAQGDFSEFGKHFSFQASDKLRAQEAKYTQKYRNKSLTTVDKEKYRDLLVKAAESSNPATLAEVQRLTKKHQYSSFLSKDSAKIKKRIDKTLKRAQSPYLLGKSLALKFDQFRLDHKPAIKELENYLKKYGNNSTYAQVAKEALNNIADKASSLKSDKESLNKVLDMVVKYPTLLGNAKYVLSLLQEESMQEEFAKRPLVEKRKIISSILKSNYSTNYIKRQTIQDLFKDPKLLGQLLESEKKEDLILLKNVLFEKGLNTKGFDEALTYKLYSKLLNSFPISQLEDKDGESFFSLISIRLSGEKEKSFARLILSKSLNTTNLKDYEKFSKLIQRKGLERTAAHNEKEIKQHLDQLYKKLKNSPYQLKKKIAEDLFYTRYHSLEKGIHLSKNRPLVDEVKKITLGKYNDARGCTSIDLRKKESQKNEGVFSKIPVRHQQLGTCYAHAAAQIIDAFRFSQKSPMGDQDYNHISSDLVLAVEHSHAENKASKDADGNLTIEGGSICSIIKQALKTGTCNSNDILPLDSRQRRDFIIDTELFFNTFKKGHTNDLDYDQWKSEDKLLIQTYCRKLIDKFHIESEFLPALTKVLSALKKNKVHDFINDILSHRCKERKHLPAGLVCESYELDRGLASVMSAETTDAFKEKPGIELIHKFLEAGNPMQPVGIGYCSGVLEQGNAFIGPKSRFSRFCGPHASAIIGRKFENGSCKFLIRNSWGKSCRGISKDIECDEGNMWIEQGKLEESLISVSRIHKK
ncbi:hypothetical protein A9Q84_03150 [Halobacteriovorax marinus]|uniref:Peptidase C1A papain C-terminal domain-containing protein n=1 Tax=Halobacteriovorax marinus TaxID=97084 RepID=A0A1Y5FGZ1_9BACT|nr:hypothetical protein A9Q84_03150 [Halobacteriovorax marinus]